MTKICSNCIHSEYNGGCVLKCFHPSFSVDLVTGEKLFHYCVVMRRGHNTQCGEDAKLYEPNFTLKEQFMARLNWLLRILHKEMK